MTNLVTKATIPKIFIKLKKTSSKSGLLKVTAQLGDRSINWAVVKILYPKSVLRIKYFIKNSLLLPLSNTLTPYTDKLIIKPTPITLKIGVLKFKNISNTCFVSLRERERESICGQ